MSFCVNIDVFLVQWWFGLQYFVFQFVKGFLFDYIFHDLIVRKFLNSLGKRKLAYLRNQPGFVGKSQLFIKFHGFYPNPNQPFSNPTLSMIAFRIIVDYLFVVFSSHSYLWCLIHAVLFWVLRACYKNRQQ